MKKFTVRFQNGLDGRQYTPVMLGAYTSKRFTLEEAREECKKQNAKGVNARIYLGKKAVEYWRIDG